MRHVDIDVHRAWVLQTVDGVGERGEIEGTSRAVGIRLQLRNAVVRNLGIQLAAEISRQYVRLNISQLKDSRNEGEADTNVIASEGLEGIEQLCSSLSISMLLAHEGKVLVESHTSLL